MTLLADYTRMVHDCLPQKVTGRVAQMRGLTVAAQDLSVPVGATCVIESRSGKTVRVEVIGFADSLALLMPLDEALGVSPGDPVTCLRAQQSVPVGESMMGRVVNAMAEPIDDGPPITAEAFYPLHRQAPPAMQRKRIDQVISTGIRSIDGTITVGAGQRLGVFAGTGVGKSVVLGMMARYTSADVTVVSLVGERGARCRTSSRRTWGRRVASAACWWSARRTSRRPCGYGRRLPPRRLRSSSGTAGWMSC